MAFYRVEMVPPMQLDLPASALGPLERQLKVALSYRMFPLEERGNPESDSSSSTILRRARLNVVTKKIPPLASGTHTIREPEHIQEEQYTEPGIILKINGQHEEEEGHFFLVEETNDVQNIQNPDFPFDEAGYAIGTYHGGFNSFSVEEVIFQATPFEKAEEDSPADTTRRPAFIS